MNMKKLKAHQNCFLRQIHLETCKFDTWVRAHTMIWGDKTRLLLYDIPQEICTKVLHLFVLGPSINYVTSKRVQIMISLGYFQGMNKVTRGGGGRENGKT